eukprot:jgi/Chlat1/9222/Chrsp98S08479
MGVGRPAWPFSCSGAIASCTQIAKEGWRRICLEVVVEWPHLMQRWRTILLALLFQYVHGVAAHGAHFLHKPGPVLHDVGFDLVPELGVSRKYMSEWVFFVILFSFITWSFHPFVMFRKRFYTAVLWAQVLTTLVLSQFFRILSFTATQLPGPNYHCREGSAAATLPPPTGVFDILALNLGKTTMFGCGDLIFSSHMTFAITFVLMFNKYASSRVLKHVAWCLAGLLTVLIIASRKHYTVDVVVAWYAVPLVFYMVDRKFYDFDMVERFAAPGAVQLLPLHSREAAAFKHSRYTPETQATSKAQICCCQCDSCWSPDRMTGVDHFKAPLRVLPGLLKVEITPKDKDIKDVEEGHSMGLGLPLQVPVRSRSVVQLPPIEDGRAETRMVETRLPDTNTNGAHVASRVENRHSRSSSFDARQDKFVVPSPPSPESRRES